MSQKGKDMMKNVKGKGTLINRGDLPPIGKGKGKGKRVAEAAGLDNQLHVTRPHDHDNIKRDVSPPPGFTRSHKFSRVKTTTTTNHHQEVIEILDGDDEGIDHALIARGHVNGRSQPLLQPMVPKLVGAARGIVEAHVLSTNSKSQAIMEKDASTFKDARRKLTKILLKNFQELVDSDGLSELARLSIILQGDETLNPDQLALLKVLVDIPIVFKNYEELNESPTINQNLSKVLEEEMARAFETKKKYDLLKTTTRRVREELEADKCAIKEIDDQILQLQERRSELCSSAKVKKLTLTGLKLSREETCDVLSNKIGDIQVLKSKKEECEERKKVVAKHQDELLANLAKYKDVALNLLI